MGPLLHWRCAFTLSLAYVRSIIGLSPVGFEDFSNLEVARLRERQGKEGRLTALVGDRSGALRADRHYLVLRSNPEPALRPKVEAIHVALAAPQEKRGSNDTR